MNWSTIKSALGKIVQNANRTTIIGSGSLQTETIAIRNFDRIVADGGFTLNITQSTTESLQVSTDDNILPHLIMEVADRTLYLRSKPEVNIQPTALRYEVQCKALDHLNTNGNGDITLNTINSTSLILQTNGSGRLSGQGNVESLEIDINGSGTFALQTLIAQKVNIDIAGTGDVAVHATHALAVTIRGSGKVTYLGTPTVEKVIQGSGSVRQVS